MSNYSKHLVSYGSTQDLDIVRVLQCLFKITPVHCWNMGNFYHYLLLCLPGTSEALSAALNVSDLVFLAWIPPTEKKQAEVWWDPLSSLELYEVPVNLRWLKAPRHSARIFLIEEMWKSTFFNPWRIYCCSSIVYIIVVVGYLIYKLCGVWHLLSYRHENREIPVSSSFVTEHLTRHHHHY